MKIKDVIAEAKMEPGLRRAMENKGYKFVGKGQDQDVYLSPYDGTILKIFGTDGDATDKKYSEGQQSVIDFIKFCQAQPNNPFLPSFGGFERFLFKGNYYLQISCERLFDFDKNKAHEIANFLERITDITKYSGVNAGFAKINREPEKSRSWQGDWQRQARERNNDAQAQTILMLGGEQRTQLLIKTIGQLATLAKRKGYGFDLHSGNFMLGSDGEIVINDPFFTGTWR